jgi:hypothetical protein
MPISSAVLTDMIGDTVAQGQHPERAVVHGLRLERLGVCDHSGIKVEQSHAANQQQGRRPIGNHPQVSGNARPESVPS